MSYFEKLPAKTLMIFGTGGEVFSRENTLFSQVSLSVLAIKHVKSDMSPEAKITVSVGVPLQLFWSILGWLAVSMFSFFFCICIH